MITVQHTNPLDPDELCDIYEELAAVTGRGSVGKVAKELARQGILSPRTLRPYTRQNVWLTMLKTKRGKTLLKQWTE